MVSAVPRFGTALKPCPVSGATCHSTWASKLGHGRCENVVGCLDNVNTTDEKLSQRSLQPVECDHSFDGPPSQTAASDDKLVLTVLPPVTIETVFRQTLSHSGVHAVLDVHKYPPSAGVLDTFLPFNNHNSYELPLLHSTRGVIFLKTLSTKVSPSPSGNLWLQEMASSSRVLQVHSRLPLSCHLTAIQPPNITHQSLDSHSTMLGTSHQSTNLTAVLCNQSHRTHPPKCLPSPTKTLPVR